jgi:hypothetical protein
MIGISPYPAGKAFAVTFVDDTDLSTRENTEPVYDLLASHGFLGTKTVWPLRARRSSAYRRSLETNGPIDPGSTLEDPDYRRFIECLQRRGFEIALHGIAAGNSLRPEIESGLAMFKDIVGAPPRVNAFHQTNIENLYCGSDKLDVGWLRLLEQAAHRSEYEGHREGAPSFWGDIVRSQFDYVRLPFHTIDDVNTLRVNPSMPFSDQRRPWVRRWFASSDGSEVLRFVRLLSASNVAQLERDRGACVIYTHFAKRFVRRRGDRWILDAEFVGTVKRVTSNRGAWFTTVSSLLDRLETIRAIGLRHSGRTLEITNHGTDAAEQLVLRLPKGMTVAGDDLEAERNGREVTLRKLAAGCTAVLLTSTDGQQQIAPGTPEIARRERRAIEFANYRGLIRGSIRDMMFYRGRQLSRLWR